MKYHIVTYGCQMNKSDSERMAAVLEKMGYKAVSKEDEADLMMVNACSVRQSAIDRIFGQCQKFAELKTQNPNLRTILTGCVLPKDKKKFREIFDLVLDTKDLPKLPQYVKFRRSPKFNVNNYWEITPKYQTPFRAYVPIMTGCNNFCAYCAVPYTRGREISRPAEDIICEVKNLAKRGCKEIWLLGENVNRYLPITLASLLKKINALSGNFWLRFTSPHPKDFSDELIKTMAKCSKVTPYLNLPVQSGDDKILKKMNRPYGISFYKNLVKKIRRKIFDICLSTDVIVGFPGETKKQFQNTAKLFREIKFDMAYISKYSPRPGTAAFKMKDNIFHAEKERRRKILNEILKKTALEKNRKHIGKIIMVLPEQTAGNFLIRKTENYKTIKFEGPKKLMGRFVKIQITDATPWGLKGKLA